MLHAQLLVQFYFFPVSCQSIPQLDVLDRWVAIAHRVEPCGLNECLSAHGTAASPESDRSLAGLEVHIAMNQVLVLREKIAPSRFVIVGAEHRCKLSVIREVLLDKSQSPFGNLDVRVHEDENVPLRVRHPQIPCSRGPQRVRGSYAASSAPLCNLRGIVGRTIIDDNDLKP